MLEEQNNNQNKGDHTGPQKPEMEAMAELFPNQGDLLAEYQNRIATLEEEVASLKDQMLRTLAEAENIKKRQQKASEDSVKFAVSNFSKDLINVLENLFRSIDFVKEEDKTNANVVKMLEGIALTRDEMLKVFDNYGLKRISPNLGDEFDHNFHQAISQVQNKDAKNNSIAQVVQAGYALHERLLRPALVVVNSAE